MADNDGLTGKELAPSVGQFLLHRGKIGQPEAIEQFGHPWRRPPIVPGAAPQERTIKGKRSMQTFKWPLPRSGTNYALEKSKIQHWRLGASNKPLLRTAGYLSAAVLLALLTSADTFAQDESKPKILEIESMGARAFGGTAVPMPDDPTNFQACDHGFAEWFIPPRAREHPMVLVHGSSSRTYQTTFDGKPGFQNLLLGERYPVYLVDLPWTGRAGKACSEYTWNPFNNTFSARFVFTNRVGLWAPNSPESAKQFFPGVAFSKDPKVLDQYLRNQYVEFNAPNNVEIESAALAVLLEELYKEHGKGAILHTHSSSHSRGDWFPGRQTHSQAKSAGNRAPLQFSRRANCRRLYRALTVWLSPPGPKFLWQNL